MARAAQAIRRIGWKASGYHGPPRRLQQSGGYRGILSTSSLKQLYGMLGDTEVPMGKSKETKKESKKKPAKTMKEKKADKRAKKEGKGGLTSVER